MADFDPKIYHQDTIKDIQRRAGVTQDGSWGPSTMRAVADWIAVNGSLSWTDFKRVWGAAPGGGCDPEQPDWVGPTKPLEHPGAAFGVDVAHHQDPADWDAVKAGGFEFAIVKLTEGVDYIDETARGHATGAKEAGVKLSYYHFATPGRGPDSDPEDEAEDFLKALGQYPALDMIPALDFEHVYSDLVDAEWMTEWALRWLRKVEAALGVKPYLYTYPSFASSHLLAGKGLEEYPLWIAHYGVSRPRVPDAWIKVGYEIWQYSSKGGVLGFTDNDVDKNVAINGLDHLMMP